MDYEKKYNEALERARKLYEQGTITESLCYVFPELIESEDERIMKALYKMAKVLRKEIYEAEGITKEQAPAWLEKKGEQKPQGKSALEAINEEKVDNANKVEPRQEKLTKFEKAVKQVMEEAIECGDTHNLKADADMLLSLIHKSAWSGEDEKILSDIVKDLVHPWNEYIPDRIEDEIKWLKNRLKSLRPQNIWKPSEEQMKVLEFFIPYVTECSVVLQKSKDTLSSLLSDLRKLREK